MFFWKKIKIMICLFHRNGKILLSGLKIIYYIQTWPKSWKRTIAHSFETFTKFDRWKNWVCTWLLSLGQEFRFKIKPDVTSIGSTNKNRIFTPFWYQNCKNCKVVLPIRIWIWMKYFWNLLLQFTLTSSLTLTMFFILLWYTFILDWSLVQILADPNIFTT